MSRSLTYGFNHETTFRDRMIQQDTSLDWQQFIDNGLDEDVGPGDHTSLACIDHNAVGEARLIMKESGVIAGIELARQIYHHIDDELFFSTELQDGAAVGDKTVVLEVKGSARSILKGERFVLNCMQRMSGVATLTSKFASEVSETKAIILDTRKTSPGARIMEKWAVRIGGGENHRMGLYDMILIKDNHIDYGGGIKEAIQKSKDYISSKKLDIKIEIEVRNMKEVEEVMAAGSVDRVLFDNFSPSELKSGIEMMGGTYETEGRQEGSCWKM